MHGRHLTLSQREVLAQRHARGAHPAAMAEELGCDVSTIYRELARNATQGQYYPARAQALADQRRRASKAPWKLDNPPLRQYVQDKLCQYWSPEQISGRLKIDWAAQPEMQVSPQGRYDWIARQKACGGTWHTYLRQSHRKRRKRYGTRENRGRIVDRVGIEDRPAEVDSKDRLGDWESDTLAGSGSSACLASHVERVSKYTVLAKLPDVKIGTVTCFCAHREVAVGGWCGARPDAAGP